ncbi:TrmH family RNA methyltransferase [Catenulispora pinisilvae]|uniref:TrmH family RNA methyltransferase n=1 Tax=Catenulispora pinisilvae TaxID=2705253 RepID=UPI001890EA80|nr:RNA methyltransferase [Catenulispora pinisilvae]
MGELIEVTVPSDPRLHDYSGLTDVELRKVREPAEGLFLAEGEKVIRRALAAGYPMRSTLLSPKWARAMRPLIDAVDAPVYVGDEALLEAVTGFHVHRGALASMQRTPLPSAGTVLERARRVVVMEDIVNHTNLGAIFRSAAALGMDAALLTPSCADPLYRRSVRVSMGTVFALPYARLDSWPGGLATLAEHGFRTVALTPGPTAIDLRDLRFGPRDKVALLLGTEGDGLSDPALAAADLRVRIPMTAGVDSLNVAAAAAVACYAIAAGS